VNQSDRHVTSISIITRMTAHVFCIFGFANCIIVSIDTSNTDT